MKKEEAKEFLEKFLEDKPNFREEHPGQDEEVYRQMDRLAEALDMAIEALGKDTDVPSSVPDIDVGDLISRAAAIGALDVLCQEHRYKIPGKRETYSQYNEAWQDALDRAEGAIFNLPSAQPTADACERPCTGDDYWYCNDCDHMEVCRYYPMKVCEYKSQPPAQPEPKRGRWLDGTKRQTCSICRYRGVRSWNYCPSCGADMRGEQE